MRSTKKESFDPVDHLRDRIHVDEAIDSALSRWPEVSVLAFESTSPSELVDALRSLLGFDEVQATAVMDMQLRRVTSLERRNISDRLADARASLRELSGD